MMITLIALFLKLYIFRQNLDNFNILVESLYGNMLHDKVVINDETSQLLTLSCIIKFYHYRFLVFPENIYIIYIYIYIYIYIFIYLVYIFYIFIYISSRFGQ